MLSHVNVLQKNTPKEYIDLIGWKEKRNVIL